MALISLIENQPTVEAQSCFQERHVVTAATTTATPKSERVKIVLSEAPPVSVLRKLWPIVAAADGHDGQVACQANRTWALRVRRHESGRTIVYGWFESKWHGDEDRTAGFLIDENEGGIVRAIRRVAGIIGCNEGLVDECIGSLPVVELE